MKENMVSILLCTYDRVHCLGNAIESVLAQTYRDWELIIVDDGSTDGTKELLRAYEKDERIRCLFLEKNRYYCYAADQGLSLCNGKYLAILNSDDVWFPDKLEKQVAFMEQHPGYGACFTEVILVDDDGTDITKDNQGMAELFANRQETRGKWMQFFLYHGNSLCHPSAVIRRSILEEIGGFNLFYCQLADFDLWIRIVTGYEIEVLPEPLIYFRWDVQNKDQISSSTERKLIRTFNEQMQIRRQMIERLTDEQMVEFFGERFQNPRSRTHLEIEFEKAFLLMDSICDVPQLKVLGMEKLEEVLRQEHAVEVLEEHFGLSLQELYQWNQGHWYLDFLLERELAEYKEKVEKLEKEQKQLHLQIKEYKESTSWKVTAPMRRICGVWKRK